MKYLTLFSNTTIEQRIRSIVKGNSIEIGGFLYATLHPTSWPVNYDHASVTHDLISNNVQHTVKVFIEDFLILPNQHFDNKTRWMYWNFDGARNIANVNSALQGSFPVHFHSHPGNDRKPSSNDLTFARKECVCEPLGMAAFFVVTPDPLRVHLHTIEDNKHNRGPFLSWKSPVLQRASAR